jgi:hypothetical protein
MEVKVQGLFLNSAMEASDSFTLRLLYYWENSHRQTTWQDSGWAPKQMWTKWLAEKLNPSGRVLSNLHSVELELMNLLIWRLWFFMKKIFLQWQQECTRTANPAVSTQPKHVRDILNSCQYYKQDEFNKLRSITVQRAQLVTSWVSVSPPPCPTRHVDRSGCNCTSSAGVLAFRNQSRMTHSY